MTTQNNNRIGLGLLGAPELLKMVELAQLAETHGFESVWVAETRLTRDGITPCAAIAMATTRLKIATGIVNVQTPPTPCLPQCALKPTVLDRRKAFDINDWPLT